MSARYITVKGSNTIALSPYYVGLVQHGRTMSKKEAYAYCAEKTGFTPTQVRAAFMALAEALPSGNYTLAVHTRSGMGDAFGVKSATRKVAVK